MARIQRSNTYDVIVIGAGAAGMMAAIRAAERGKKVLLIEKNTILGKKLSISGGGRCNITNGEFDAAKLLSNFGDAKEFLFSSFSQFGVKDTFTFFESLGLPLVVQGRNRVFPQTEKAIDVVRALSGYLKELGVTIVRDSGVQRVIEKAGWIQSVVSGSQEYSAHAYICAVGGVSHPETGSTGDGFGWLKVLGHTIIDPTPTIVPLRAKEQWIKKLSGTTIPEMKISFYLDGKKKFSKVGPLLFTHTGISGPTVLNSAGAVGDLLYEGNVEAFIDIAPKEDVGIFDARISGIFIKNKNKILKNVLKEIMPPGTVEVFLSLLPQIDPEKKVHSVTKEERKSIAKLFKAIPLTITGLMGFDQAVVADGGVPLSEIDTKTFRSKRIPNLFIIGDLLNIRRPSGGYSLQLCWTTGHVAGINA